MTIKEGSKDMKQKQFTTSMNRKVCYEAGCKDTLDEVEEWIMKIFYFKGDPFVSVSRLIAFENKIKELREKE